MLDLDVHREAVPPRDAATVILVRDAKGASIEVFCVVRHAKSGFLGGAVVFPGGKVDESDRHPAWAARATGARCFFGGEDVATARAFAVAACREALEEAAILPAASVPLGHDDTLALRARLATNGGATFHDVLATRDVSLDVSMLHPFARWVTPVAESRRFDTRFFLACAPADQGGAHDAHETTASFWAAPADVLRRFDAGELQLAPPTHRCLELLTTVSSSREAVALAARLGRDPICPMLVPVRAAGQSDTLALVLPGDPEHEETTARVPGLSRFVLRDGRWLPEAARDKEHGP
jgi:8-oxo-dGTP pyrophosphatase MutT (NUDIX family)